MQVTQDRKLLIAVGRSRKAAVWQNKEILWSELLDKLSSTTRTRESAEEYARLEKMERDNIKDIGGFVGGYLDKLLPEDWSKMDLAARRGFLRGDPFNGGDKTGTVKRQSVCVMEIWAECFGRDPGTIKKTDRNEILSILAKLGWKNGMSNPQRTAYGIQKCFPRPEP